VHAKVGEHRRGDLHTICIRKLVRPGPPQDSLCDSARNAMEVTKSFVLLLRSSVALPPANGRDARCAVYFAIPEPFELEAFRSDGLAGTLPCEVRACWLSLSARVFRSCFRPLTSRSENSRGSIEESKLVSGEGFDHRLQARRIKRKMTRRFLISRPTQKPPYARWERRANRGQSFADCR
jgi:hypothetical protein